MRNRLFLFNILTTQVIIMIFYIHFVSGTEKDILIYPEKRIPRVGKNNFSFHAYKVAGTASKG